MWLWFFIITVHVGINHLIGGWELCHRESYQCSRYFAVGIHRYVVVYRKFRPYLYHRKCHQKLVRGHILDPILNGVSVDAHIWGKSQFRSAAMCSDVKKSSETGAPFCTNPSESRLIPCSDVSLFKARFRDWYVCLTLQFPVKIHAGTTIGCRWGLLLYFIVVGQSFEIQSRMTVADIKLLTVSSMRYTEALDW